MVSGLSGWREDFAEERSFHKDLRALRLARTLGEKISLPFQTRVTSPAYPPAPGHHISNSGSKSPSRLKDRRVLSWWYHMPCFALLWARWQWARLPSLATTGVGVSPSSAVSRF